MLWSLKRSLNFQEMYEDQSGEFVYRNWGFTPHSHPSLKMFESCLVEHSFFLEGANCSLIWIEIYEMNHGLNCG